MSGPKVDVHVTGAKVREILEDIVGKITADWDKKLAHIASRLKTQNEAQGDLRGRVDRLERILDRIGKAALQEKP
jgi:hypothetical protein